MRAMPGMSLRFAAILLCLLPAAAVFAAPPASEDLARASSSSRDDLNASLKELADLRETIASEKIPLTKELSVREERLTRLRREHESLIRSLDSGSLGDSTTQGELKLRADELAYIESLLNEYARGFESKLDVSEVSRYSALTEAAKNLSENQSAEEGERLDAYQRVVFASIDRLNESIGGSRFKGSAVDPQGTLTDGSFALIGPVAIFASNDGGTAGIAMAQTGSRRPVVRPLDVSMTAGLALVVTAGEGILPFDPSRGGAIRELVEKANIIHIFKKGGPIMWPLLAVSILVLATVIERIVFIFNERRKRDEQGLAALFTAVERGDFRTAARAGESSSYFVARALGYALNHPETSMASALMYSSAKELKRFNAGLPILDTSITISPLLGLLGTVTGMMSSFALIGGELSSPGAITGGIAEALIATGYGLSIAIIALLPFNYLNKRVDDARHELEAASTQLELLVKAARDDARMDRRTEPPEPSGRELGLVREGSLVGAGARG